MFFEPGMSCQLRSFYKFLCICISGDLNDDDDDDLALSLRVIF